MDNTSSQGLLADDFRSPYGQSKKRSDIRYVPVSHQPRDGIYNRVPGTETGYPSPAFSSPGLSTLASPGPSKSLEEVKSFSDMKQTDAILKHRIRLLKFLLRLATLLLSLYMIATMSLTFYKYLSTRHHLVSIPSPSGPLPPRGPWAKHTKTWPSTLLLLTSTLSFLISAVVMAAYGRGIHAANAADEYGSYLGMGIVATHVAMWIAVAAAYRAGKDGNDLWGWTCDERATRIQKPFEQVIDFKWYCDLQTSSWVTSLAQAVVMLLYVAVYAWGYMRLERQREMGRRFSAEVYEHKEGRWSRLVPTRR